MVDSTINLAQWMTQLPNRVKQIPLINLAIPGKRQFIKLFRNKHQRLKLI